jgi:hypothetical protein
VIAEHHDFPLKCKLSPTPDIGKKAVAEAGVIMVKLVTRSNWASVLMARNAVCLAISLWITPPTF